MASCVSFVLVRYFHLSTFFWMFIEGKQKNEPKLSKIVSFYAQNSYT